MNNDIYDDIIPIIDDVESGKIMLENVINEDIIVLNIVCPNCGNTSSIEVWRKDYDNYILNNYNIDTCFFYISKEDRETIKTGICKDCINI